jgi:hypothetical protein
MPAPNRQNRLRYMPGTTQHFPNFVIEIAYRNETPERFIEDANNKYFTATTSVQIWLGVKIFDDNNPASRQFWGIWGVRSLYGIGMAHRETTADANGNEACLKVQSAVPLIGQFTIPSSYIYYPHGVPQNVAPNLIIRWETLRLAIEQGYQGM